LQTHPKSPAKPVQQKQPKPKLHYTVQKHPSLLSDKQTLQNRSLKFNLRHVLNELKSFFLALFCDFSKMVDCFVITVVAGAQVVFGLS
jgi:hypothetical protein